MYLYTLKIWYRKDISEVVHSVVVHSVVAFAIRIILFIGTCLSAKYYEFVNIKGIIENKYHFNHG